VEADTSPQSITIENSSIRETDLAINIEDDTNSSELTAIIKGNDVVDLDSENTIGILIGPATATVTNNFATGMGVGIQTLQGAAGSVSGNILMNTQFGVFAEADGVPISSNKILNSANDGILLTTTVAAIHSNSITNSLVGIDFECFANANVHSNTIADAGTALDRVPLGIITTNSYFNAGVIRTGGCQ
jgi:hypothetical protein